MVVICVLLLTIFWDLTQIQQHIQMLRSVMGQYCLITTYIIWLTLGLFGGHHFYLNNDHQGFVWLWTCGGFVFGWLSEMWQIQSYVLAAEVEFQKAGLPIHHISVHNRPFRIKRIVGEIAFSVYLGYLTISALPIKALFDFPWTSSVIGAFAVATGVHTVANIGQEECRYAVCLLGAFLHFPVFFLGTMDTIYTSIICSSMSSTFCVTFWGRRRRTNYRVRRPLSKRLKVIFLCSFGMLCLFVMRFYFHGKIQQTDGKKGDVMTLVNNITEHHWQVLKGKAKKLERVLDEGFRMVLWILTKNLIPSDQQHAYKVLGVNWFTTEEGFRSRYRELVKTYHPDKLMKHTPKERKEAEIRFIAIQQSYEKLFKKRRKIKPEI